MIISIKNMSVIFFLFIIILLTGCRKDEDLSNAGPANTMKGSGTVEGYVGFFSPVLSPKNSFPDGLTAGYAFASYHWIIDTPQCSYAMIYLVGKDSALKTALYVKASGKWESSTPKSGAYNYSYLKLAVDSLEIIQKK